MKGKRLRKRILKYALVITAVANAVVAVFAAVKQVLEMFK